MGAVEPQFPTAEQTWVDQVVAGGCQAGNADLDRGCLQDLFPFPRQRFPWPTQIHPHSEYVQKVLDPLCS